MLNIRSGSGSRAGALACLALFGLTATGCELLAEIAAHGKGGSGSGGGSSGPTAPVPPPSGGGADAGSAPPGSPGGATSCFGAGTGAAGPVDPSQCKSAGEWKQSAYESCTSQKANLTDLKLSQPCGGDLYAGMQYTCCTSGTPGPDQPGTPKPPTPPGPACAGGTIGGGMTCVAGHLLKDKAAAACANGGMVMTNFGFYGACADGVSYEGAKYECCAATSGTGTPTPGTPPGSTTPGTPTTDPGMPTMPPQACRKFSDGGPTSCKDPGTWKQYADTSCTNAGLVLTEVYPRESCGADLYRYSDFVCCQR